MHYYVFAATDSILLANVSHMYFQKIKSYFFLIFAKARFLWFNVFEVTMCMIVFTQILKLLTF